MRSQLGPRASPAPSARRRGGSRCGWDASWPVSWAPAFSGGRLLLNGYFDELAYDLGAFDRSLPFPELKARSLINERARAADADPRFSVRIREGLPRMSLDHGRSQAAR